MLLIIILIPIVYAINTQNNHFQVIPDNLFLNWTNNYSSSIYVYFNKSNLTIEILNSTPLIPHYSQQNVLTKCLNNPQGYRLHVFINDTGTNILSNYSLGDNVTVILKDIDHLDCKPGRYYTNSFSLIDKNNSSEYVNISIHVDIPISYSNNPKLNEGKAEFEGFVNNSINSFYFNSSLIENVTTISINVSKNLGIFLLENEKVIERVLGKELNANIEKNKIYEIRLSGNCSYTGNIVFSGINSSVEKIDFGILNVTQENFTVFRIGNDGSFLEEDIKENVTLYHVDEFYGNSHRNFSFLIQENVEALIISLKWGGNATHLVNVYDEEDNMVGSSQNWQNLTKHANIDPEEYVIINKPKSGIWKVEVKNLSQSSSYNLTIYKQIPPFLTSNLTTITLKEKEFTDVNLSIKIPVNALNGKYVGHVKFSSKRGGTKIIRLHFNVTTSTLLVNNTLKFDNMKIRENYGKSGFIEQKLILNNTGTYDANIQLVSSGKLYYGNHFINISHSEGLSLPKNSFCYLSVNLSYNNSAPPGNYVGWIIINTTGKEEERSHPKSYYNIAIEVQLTDELIPNILELKTSSNNNKINNASKEENVTMRFKVFYVNGTEIEAGNILSTNNFTVWLEHTNLTYRVPERGSLALYNGTQPLYHEGDYEINFTVPPNLLGGFYKTYVEVKWKGDYFSYGGIGHNSTLFINNTALYISTPNSTSFVLTPSSSIRFVVNVTNYGSQPQNPYTIRLNESCDGYSVSAHNIIGCSGSLSGDGITFTPLNSCLLVWQIQAGSSNASACSARINVNPQVGVYDPWPINLSVTVKQEITPTTTTIDEQEMKTEEEEENINYFSVELENKISVEQGSNKTLNVKVKNLYKKPQTIKLSVYQINSSWYRISPAEINIPKGDYYIYRIIFNIPEDASIGEYKGKIKIESVYSARDVNFTLSVLPGNRIKELINSTLSNYEIKLQEIESKFNNTQNETILSKINEIKSKINEIKSYINKGDYSSAYNKLYEIKKLFDEISIYEQKEKPKSFVNIPLILIASSGVLFASALGYKIFETKKKSVKWNKVSVKNELNEIKASVKFKELKDEIAALKDKERELEKEIRELEKKEKELEKMD
ncbi:MAG: hypothetical protein QXM38_03850 [Candidatus Aenigmatarchaeota archaeon]